MKKIYNMLPKTPHRNANDSCTTGSIIFKPKFHLMYYHA